jgi:hypothetical protein
MQGLIDWIVAVLSGDPDGPKLSGDPDGPQIRRQ